jgi:hypothetical protein
MRVGSILVVSYSSHIFLNFKNIKIIIHFTLSCTFSTTVITDIGSNCAENLDIQHFNLSHKINLLQLMMNRTISCFQT